jgi:ATP-dependent RNA helicase DDX24/MAK5
LPKLKERVHIAKSIEKAAHHAKKDKHDKNWLKEAAEAMDIDIDPDMLCVDEMTIGAMARLIWKHSRSSDKDSDDEAPRRTNKKVPSDAKLAGLRAELDSLLQQQLMARGVSAKYPTSGSRVVIDDLMTNSSEYIPHGKHILRYTC